MLHSYGKLSVSSANQINELEGGTIPRKGLNNCKFIIDDFKSLSSLDIYSQFPELQTTTGNYLQEEEEEEKEKLIRKYHLIQLLLKVYPFPSDFSFLQKYRLEGLLGDGTFGFVLSATYLLTNEQVAIKFIAKKSIKRSNIDGKGRGIPVEIEILSQCHHPNIIKYWEYYEDLNYYILITELFGHEWNSKNEPEIAQLKNSKSEPEISQLKNSKSEPEITQWNNYNSQNSLLSFEPKSKKLTSFYQFIQQFLTNNFLSINNNSLIRYKPRDLFECIERLERIPDKQIKRIINQLLTVIQYLSTELQFCHSDIKDENILIDSQFNIKLIDFGSALSQQQIEANLVEGKVKFYGTLQFAPPEVLSGDGYRGVTSDLWSVGSLLYLMITGTNYLTKLVKVNGMGEGKKKRDVYSYQLNDLIEIMNFIDDIELYDLIASLLTDNWRERITLEQAISHSWLQ